METHKQLLVMAQTVRRSVALKATDAWCLFTDEDKEAEKGVSATREFWHSWLLLLLLIKMKTE